MNLMKSKGNITSSVIIVIVAFLSSGCASFRTGDLHHISHIPPVNEEKGKSICIIVSNESTLNGKKQPDSLTSLRYLRDQAAKAYQDSGIFSEVITGNSDTDLKAEIEIKDSNRRRIGVTYLAGLTFFLLPTKGTDELIVKTTIKNKDGNTIAMYEKSETITTWVHLFLVIAMPFHAPGTVYEETLSDLNRSTIVELHSKGFL
jgi:hypothetical protein